MRQQGERRSPWKGGSSGKRRRRGKRGMRGRNILLVAWLDFILLDWKMPLWDFWEIDLFLANFEKCLSFVLKLRWPHPGSLWEQFSKWSVRILRSLGNFEIFATCLSLRIFEDFDFLLFFFFWKKKLWLQPGSFWENNLKMSMRIVENFEFQKILADFQSFVKRGQMCTFQTCTLFSARFLALTTSRLPSMPSSPLLLSIASALSEWMWAITSPKKDQAMQRCHEEQRARSKGARLSPLDVEPFMRIWGLLGRTKKFFEMLVSAEGGGWVVDSWGGFSNANHWCCYVSMHQPLTTLEALSNYWKSLALLSYICFQLFSLFQAYLVFYFPCMFSPVGVLSQHFLLCFGILQTFDCFMFSCLLTFSHST